MQAYSLDLRERVVDDRVAGLRTAEVARKYRVSPAWVRRLLHRYRATGQVAPKRRTQYRAPLLQPVIPNNPPRKRKHPFDKTAYRTRNVIERTFCRLKDWRRVATRYDKLAHNYLASVALAALVIYWL